MLAALRRFGYSLPVGEVELRVFIQGALQYELVPMMEEPEAVEVIDALDEYMTDQFVSRA
ncbi:MAG: hypothetical protein R3A47_03870 [Polyangiales bacterium]